MEDALRCRREWESLGSRRCFHAFYPVPPEVWLRGYCSAHGLDLARQVLVLSEAFSDIIPAGDYILRALFEDVPSGYDWCVEHYGTKWDVVEVEMDDCSSGDGIYYYFETTWSPPSRWLSKVAADWPRLTFELTYCEPGGAFAGRVCFVGGSLVKSDEVCAVTDGDEAFRRWVVDNLGFDPLEGGG